MNAAFDKFVRRACGGIACVVRGWSHGSHDGVTIVNLSSKGSMLTCSVPAVTRGVVCRCVSKLSALS